jgi:hypothetical protein
MPRVERNIALELEIVSCLYSLTVGYSGVTATAKAIADLAYGESLANNPA